RYADALGNPGLASAASLTFDTLSHQVTLDLDAASDSGTHDDDNITNDATPTFTGTGEEGARVNLYAIDRFDPGNRLLLGTSIVSGGVWSITADPLAQGNYQLIAQSTDAAGNLGAPSQQLDVRVQLSAPMPHVGFLEGDGVADGVANLFELQFQQLEYPGQY